MNSPLATPDIDGIANAIRHEMGPRVVRIESMDPLIAEIMRRKTPAQTLEMAFDTYRTAREMVGATVRLDHPDADDATVSHEIARRMFGGPIRLFSACHQAH